MSMPENLDDFLCELEQTAAPADALHRESCSTRHADARVRLRILAKLISPRHPLGELEREELALLLEQLLDQLDES